MTYSLTEFRLQTPPARQAKLKRQHNLPFVHISLPLVQSCCSLRSTCSQSQRVLLLKIACSYPKPRLTQPSYGLDLGGTLPQPLPICLILGFHLTPFFNLIHCVTCMNTSFPSEKAGRSWRVIGLLSIAGKIPSQLKLLMGLNNRD